MSWNRQESKKSEEGKMKRRGGRSRVPLVLLVLVVLLLLGIAAWWVAMPRDDKAAPQPRAPNGGGQIAEVKSAVAPPPATKGQKEGKKLSRRERELKEIRDKFGDNIPESLKATVYFLEHPPQQTFKVRSKASFLRHPSERQIEGVVLAEPGSFFVVKPEFGESFDQDFMTALLDKIEVNDDDSEETRAIKENVSAVKKEIAEICKREGRKPSEVMNEHAAAMYELGRFQRDLEEELDRIHANEEYSDKDVEDFCEAANRLLKAKGLAPIQHLDLTRRSFRIKSMQRMAERRAAREKAKEERK